MYRFRTEETSVDTNVGASSAEGPNSFADGFDQATPLKKRAATRGEAEP